jgi:hypothetical protein
MCDGEYAQVNEGGPPGIRTPNLRIKSPQLCQGAVMSGST